MLYEIKLRLVIFIIAIAPFQLLAGQEVMVEQVLNNPDRYHGTVISIRGFISIEFENMTIAVSEKHKFGDCVWVEFDERPYEADEDAARYDKRKGILKAKYNKKRSTIKGLFVSGRSGHFGICSGKLNVLGYEVRKNKKLMARRWGLVSVIGMRNK